MRPEDALQISVVDYLTRNNLFAFHIKNQGKWSAGYGRKLKRMGRKAGMPDLQVVTAQSDKLPRGVFMIECKAPPKRLRSGRLSQALPRVDKEQDAMMARLAALGIPTLIIRSLDDLELALIGLGVAVKTRSRLA